MGFPLFVRRFFKYDVAFSVFSSVYSGAAILCIIETNFSPSISLFIHPFSLDTTTYSLCHLFFLSVAPFLSLERSLAHPVDRVTLIQINLHQDLIYSFVTFRLKTEYTERSEQQQINNNKKNCKCNFISVEIMKS